MDGRRVRKVIVVGAGIAGPVLGMWLRRLGLEVVVAEARADAALGEGAFLGVAPNGMSALDALGVAALVAERGHACDALHFANGKGRDVGAIDRRGDRARFGWPLTMIRRDKLHEVLAAEAVRRGVEIRWGERLVSIDRTRPDRVRARFAGGGELEGDVLVGCDGLRSRVREELLPSAPAPSFAGLWDYGGFCAGPALPFAPGVNQMVFGERAFFGAFTTPSGETWWFHNGPPEDDEDGAPLSGAAPDDRARARLLALHANDPPWIGELIRATPRILGAWPIHELRAMPRWTEGRVCLIGDAAHAMSPSAGQGASLAMEDAMELARCLRDVDEPARAFEIFEALRRPRVDAIFEHARRNGSGKAPTSRLAAAFRDRMLPLFLRLGGSAQTRSYAYRIDWDARVAAA